MNTHYGWAAAAVLVVGVTVVAGPVSVEVVKDRASFIPQRKFQPLPGKAVGLLISDVVPIMGYDGRSGPPKALGFSRDGQSYRWVYVPVNANPMITNLKVRVGEKGTDTKVYPSLSMADPETVKQWDITMPSAILVEVEVNDGLGAPADEGFVATKMKVAEGTKEYPFKAADVIAKVRESYQLWVKDQEKAIDATMAKAQKDAIGDKKPTGPREKNELVYLSWMPETERLRIVFRMKITDGDYQYGSGVERDPPALPPVKPGKEKAPPPPPKGEGVRYGTSFGVEFGMAYEIAKDGKTVAKQEKLALEPFKQVLPPPPAAPRFPRDPIPLPPPPGKPGPVKD